MVAFAFYRPKTAIPLPANSRYSRGKLVFHGFVAASNLRRTAGAPSSRATLETDSVALIQWAG
jgi:hypothetical protein